MKKDKQFSIRISERDLETIRRKAVQAHMSQSDYVIACCLGKRIVILDGLKEVLRQQKAIGNNLNQLTVLANMGKVQFANLDTAASRLANCTLPMFASTVSWLRLFPMAFCCRRTSFNPSRITIRFPRQQAVT